MNDMRTIEEIKAVLDIEEQLRLILSRSKDIADRTALVIAIDIINHAKDIKIERHNEICNAEKERNLIILTEQLKLSINAGARAIESNKRYQYGTSYVINPLSDNSKSISFMEAASILRETAKLE